MPMYIMLTTLTDEGRKTVRKNPERIKEVNKEVEKMGVKIKDQFLVMGAYDFVNIIEAPDEKTVIKVAIDLGSRGTVQTRTFPAYSIDEFIAMMK